MSAKLKAAGHICSRPAKRSYCNITHVPKDSSLCTQIESGLVGRSSRATGRSEGCAISASPLRHTGKSSAPRHCLSYAALDFERHVEPSLFYSLTTSLKPRFGGEGDLPAFLQAGTAESLAGHHMYRGTLDRVDFMWSWG